MEKQLVVAELRDNFERFSADVNHDLHNMTLWIMYEMHGCYGDWLGHQFETLLAWKEDFFARFIPKLDGMAQEILELQNWADTVAGDGSEADTSNRKYINTSQVSGAWHPLAPSWTPSGGMAPFPDVIEAIRTYTTSGVGLVVQFDVDSELWKSGVGLWP